jgi:hypothetical protein
MSSSSATTSTMPTVLCGKTKCDVDSELAGTPPTDRKVGWLIDSIIDLL